MLMRVLMFLAVAGLILYAANHPQEAAGTARAFGGALEKVVSGFGAFLASLVPKGK